jgi:hypothetical protein
MPLIVQYASFDPNLARTLPRTPSLTGWSRLEVQPTSTDYAAALEARIADPLWLIARQWQFGEFRGEDAGTPVEVRLAGKQTLLDRFHAGAFGADPAAASTPYDPAALPLEPLIEAEDPAQAGLLFAAIAGQQFQRMVAAAGLNDPISGRREFALDVPADIDMAIDADGAGWAAILAGRAIDGHALAAAISRTGGVPSGVAGSAGLKAVCLAWLDWYRGGLGGDRPSSWLPGRLEYGFAAGAGPANNERVLVAKEYSNGLLDWHSVDIAAKPSLGGQSQASVRNFSPMLPTPARYGGMPADRYWELEDGRVNLAQVQAGPTDLGRLLMLEFALGYGNDWFVIPVDVAMGSLFTVTRFEVRDNFGVSTDLRRVANPAGEAWRMFELSGANGFADTVLMAPTLSQRLEGDPLEETALLRDEMANMAWAVERKVQGTMGLPIDRYREASLRATNRRLADLSDVAAEIVYRVATSVPEHWIPFVPVPVPNGTQPAGYGIELERRAMMRHLADGTLETVQPLGMLLRTDLTLAADAEPALRLADEEVPRDGAVLTRSAQFTRWINGERLHWIGRTKRMGKGEGASGLRHDIRMKKSDLGR